MRRALVVVLLIPGFAGAQVPRAECFPVERLTPELRTQAEAMLLRIMDGEGLYTVVGGLKPMSSGWHSIRMNPEKPDVDKLETTRRVLAVLRSGNDIETFLQPFTRVYEKTRSLDAVVCHRGAFAAKVREKAPFFGYFGLSPSSPPEEVVLGFESDASPRRNRAYGYLFGYPDYAVDFFVESEETYRRTKEFVKRDFFSVPVYGNKDHRFVWAIPKGASPRPEDLRLREATAPILAYYTRERAKYVGPGKPGIAALIRDWFDDGKGVCSPETALRKAQNASKEAA